MFLSNLLRRATRYRFHYLEKGMWIRIDLIPIRIQTTGSIRIHFAFKYIKRLLRKYKKDGELRSDLLINHFIILYNIFGEATTPMLFYKMEDTMWTVIKTFVVFLNKLPEYPKTHIHDIPIDNNCLKELRRVSDYEC